MSIRLRLALWYGALFALILLLVGLLTYALHTRGHYDDRDRLLVTSAVHATSEVTSGTDRLQFGSSGATLEVVLQLFDRNGTLREAGADSGSVPSLTPHAVLASPAGPAFDSLAGLAPGIGIAEARPGAAFGLIAEQDQRWRAYVLPIGDASAPAGYIVALTPLGRLDASIAAFRSSLLGIGLVGLVAALAGGWAIAGRALRPIDHMTSTARMIAQARDTSHRVEMPPTHDELGRLAETFNTMLTSLEESARAQQRFVDDACMNCARRSPPPRATWRSSSGSRRSQLPSAAVDLDSVVLETFQAARPLARGQTLPLYHLNAEVYSS
jgi:two-component system OmpR family sensor kinase